MKTKFLLIKFSLISAILFFSLSCNNQANEQEEKTDTISTGLSISEQEYVPDIEKTSDLNQDPDFFVINVMGTPHIKEAVEQVKALRSKGHPSGYLWVPDYASLSGKEMYSVFIGPFNMMDTSIKYLEQYRKNDPNAYAVKVGHGIERTTIMGKYDIRINDKRQFLILTYATPEDEDEYYEGGGEDWGWFTADVHDYFMKHYPDKVLFSSVFNGWLSPSDIKSLQKELSLENFGYVLINGKNKSFTPHDLPNGVISQACEFFGIEHKE